MPSYPVCYKKFKSKTGRYMHKRIVYGGYTFDSKKEYKFYLFLEMLKNRGNIESIEVHKRYPIEVNNVRICDYVTDFVVTYNDGQSIVYDVKASQKLLTPEYKLKKKLMYAVHKINIIEVYKIPYVV